MSATPPLRLGIAGLGTVGCGTLEILTSQRDMLRERAGQELAITAVSAKSRGRDRGIDLSAYAWEDDATRLAARDDVDVVVELIGGSEGTARALCEAAIDAGKHVVTANKALIAHHGARLAAQAQTRGVQLMFEAAVAGGIPVIQLMRYGLAANRFHRLVGILNGTCNYILTTMERTGRQFDDVLAEAQALGYAEADPGFDIDGVDAAHKLAILSALAFGCTPDLDGMYVEGIRGVAAHDIAAAADLGYAIRLIGVAQRQGDDALSLRVHPALLPAEYPIGEVDGVYNAVHIFGDAVGDIFIEGQGAGRMPTASAVVSDIIDVARGTALPPFIVPASALTPARILPMDAHESAYYLRLSVEDHPGVLAAITRIFETHGISVARLIQREEEGGACILLTTHEVREAAMREALSAIAALGSTRAAPCMIRIEPGER